MLPVLRDRVALELVSLAFSLATLGVLYAAAYPDRRHRAIAEISARWGHLSGLDARAWRASPPAIFARRRRAELELAEHRLEATVS